MNKSLKVFATVVLSLGILVPVSFAFASPSPAKPDLTATKTNDLGGAHATVGTAFNWTIKVANTGNADATFNHGETLLTDDLPSGVTYGTPSVTSNGITGSGTLSCSISSNTLTCKNTSSQNNHDVTIGDTTGYFTVTFSATPSNDGTLTNPTHNGDCTADPSDKIDESNEHNNDCSNTVTVDPLRPDLTATKTNNLSGGDATVGAPFNWTIKVANTGAADADQFHTNDIILKDQLPTGATYGSPSISAINDVDHSGISCSIVSGTLICKATNSSISINNPDGYFSVTFSVTPTVAGTLTNPKSGGTCAVDPDTNVTESNENNNTCSDSVTVVNPTGTLAVIKQVSGGTAQASDFTLQVADTGTSTYSFAGNLSGTPVTLPNNSSYTVTEESGGPSNYTATFSGDCDQNGTGSMSVASSKTCTVTNTYVPPAPQCNAAASQIVVSDTTTQEDGHDSALVSIIHSRWTAIISGLEKWIWGTDPYTDPNFDATVTTTETFTKTFVITGTPLDSTLNIAADNTYDVTINGHEIKTDPNEDNYSVTGQDLNVLVPAADLTPGTNTIVVTVTNLPIAGDTAVQNPAGLLYSLTVNEDDCNIPPVITVDATKVVCTDPTQMPHWGAGGSPITSTTATAWVADHNSCKLTPGWSFQYGDQNAGDGGDATIGPVAGYTTFGPTNVQGSTSVIFPIGSASEFHLREVLQSGFIPFTYDSASSTPNGNPNSAEFYCSNDVLNYDNWDFIRSPQAGSTYYCVAFNSPVVVTPPTSTVTMCKVDDAQPANPLANWTLTLEGAHVGTVSVNSNGATSTIPNVPAGNYVLTATGSYTYRADAVATTSDAAYSYRSVSDTVYGGPYAPWVRENNFPAPNTGWLGVMLNDSFTDWGSIFNPDHVYVSATTTSATSDFSFNILDDQYSDNSGAISVDLDNGYEGLTGDNGCTTFNNVPYGTYTAGELAQAGWSNVSGLGSVTVDQPEQTFTVVNHNDTPPAPTSLKVHILKYLDNGNSISQVPDDAGVTPFPMVSSWSAVNIGSGSGSYVLGNNEGGTALKYAADTSAMSVPANYSTSEVTGGNSQVLPEGSECSPGKYVLEGYRTGDALSDAETATTDLSAPAFTGLTADKYVIVVNKLCPSPATLTIVKHTSGGDGEFNFSVVNDDTSATWDSPTVSTTDGTGSSTAISLDPATYTVTEVVPGGWTLDTETNAPVCMSGDQDVGQSVITNPNGLDITVSANDNVTCTFTNTKNGGGGGEPTETSQTITVQQGDLSSSYPDAFSTGNWFFADDQNNVVDNTLGSFVDGPDTAPLNDGSAEISVTEPTQGVVLGTFALAGTPLSEVQSLAYSTYRSAGDPVLALALQFDINPNITVSTTTYDGRLVYEPYYTHTVLDNTWQTWDPQDDSTSAGHGNWWFSKLWIATETGCTQATPCTWSQVLAALPHIGISTAGGTYFKAGSNWSSDFTGDVDKFVIDVNDGSNATTTTYDFEPTVDNTPDFTPDFTPPSPGPGGGGIFGSFGIVNSGGGGVVEGTSTEASSCDRYLTSYIRQGKQNDSSQVTKLQEFLNDLEGNALQINGVYDDSTLEAVDAFQLKYKNDVLTPWGTTDPTGYVYYTTQKEINIIYCHFTQDFPLTSDQLAEIARIKGLGQSYDPGTVLGTSTQKGVEEGNKQSSNGGTHTSSTTGGSQGGGSVWSSIWKFFFH